MKIITNPPFRINRKKFAALVKSADDYVIIHTFRFCNNELGRFELIMPEEWPEVWNSMAISSKSITYNKEQMPDFFLKKLTLEDKDIFDKYYHPSNTHYTDILRSTYKHLIFNEVTEQSFIAKVGNKKIKKGEIKNFIYVVPKKDYSKYEEQIFIDTYKWCSPMIRCCLIRREFVDEDNN